MYADLEAQIKELEENAGSTGKRDRWYTNPARSSPEGDSEDASLRVKAIL